jgi:hypothetical protein
LYNALKCPSHLGCQGHDNCYDLCPAIFGDGKVAGITCRRACDAKTLAENPINSWKWLTSKDLTDGGYWRYYIDPAATGIFEPDLNSVVTSRT